jgi:hypothetical protein
VRSTASKMQNSRIAQLLEDVRLASELNFQIMAALRKLVLASVKEATEEVKYGGILFAKAKPFCRIFAYKNHVTIEFSNGAALQDEAKFLQGSGKLRRHIQLNQVQDLKHFKVASYVKATATATA